MIVSIVIVVAGFTSVIYNQYIESKAERKSGSGSNNMMTV